MGERRLTVFVWQWRNCHPYQCDNQCKEPSLTRLASSARLWHHKGNDGDEYERKRPLSESGTVKADAALPENPSRAAPPTPRSVGASRRSR